MGELLFSKGQTSNGLVYIPIPDRNENGGVVPVEPGTSNCPPGSCNLLSSPYRNNKKEVVPQDDFFLATSNGLEPSTSSVTGWRANRLHHEAR